MGLDYYKDSCKNKFNFITTVSGLLSSSSSRDVKNKFIKSIYNEKYIPISLLYDAEPSYVLDEFKKYFMNLDIVQKLNKMKLNSDVISCIYFIILYRELKENREKYLFLQKYITDHPLRLVDEINIGNVPIEIKILLVKENEYKNKPTSDIEIDCNIENASTKQVLYTFLSFYYNNIDKNNMLKIDSPLQIKRRKYINTIS